MKPVSRSEILYAGTLAVAGVISVILHLVIANVIHGIWNNLQGEEYFVSIWNFSCTVIYHPIPSITVLALDLLPAVLMTRRMEREEVGDMSRFLTLTFCMVPFWFTMLFVGGIVLHLFDFRFNALLPSTLSDGYQLSEMITGLWWPLLLPLAVAGIYLPLRTLRRRSPSLRAGNRIGKRVMNRVLLHPVSAFTLVAVSGWTGWHVLRYLYWMLR